MSPLRHVPLRILREYRYEIEQQLGEIVDRYRSAIEQMSHQTLQAQNSGEAHRELRVVESMYPQHLRRSFITLLLAITEDGLRDFCRKMQRPASLPKPDNLQEIGRVLSTHEVLDTSDAQWSTFNDLAQVRNALVHNGACAAKAKEDRRQRIDHLAKLRIGLSVDQNSSDIRLSANFCEWALVQVEAMVNSIEAASGRQLWQTE